MESGSSVRANPGSKGFDFGSDDILCSYEDYANQDSSNGSHGEPVIASNTGKDFHKSRMARSAMFPVGYNQPEDSSSQDVIATVEKSMKKYADNLMRFLEGLSSRLSQLELYCYNLDKSIGEMRSDLVRDHGEADSKLKSLEKHLQEVHRSVQILRDKQELAETQKELAKLQLAQKESSSSHSQSNEEKASSAAADSKKTDNASDAHNQQLVLALPHQVVPQQQPVAPPPQAPTQNLTQQQPYYLPPTQLPNPPAQTQHPQSQYPHSDSQYRTPLQDISRAAPQPAQSQVNQTPPVQAFPQYQQQWPQQSPQPPQQPLMQPQIRPSSAATYPSYPPSQPTNLSPPESLPSSMAMQVQFPGIPQPVSSRADAIPYGYSGAGRTVPQQPPQQIKGTFGGQPGDGYSAPGPQPTLPQGSGYSGAGRTVPQQPPQQIKGTFGGQPGDGYSAPGPQSTLPQGSAYMMYDSEGRAHHPPQPPHFPQGGYPPTSVPLQNPPPPTTGPNHMVRNPSYSQFFRNHPYSDLIEKLVSMGCRGDHVASVIQRMEESGQPVDFNTVLDRLNMHSSGGSQRGW